MIFPPLLPAVDPAVSLLPVPGVWSLGLILGLVGGCAFELARRDRGRLSGRRAVTLGLLAALPLFALAYAGLDMTLRGGDGPGHIPAALLLGGVLGALMWLEALCGRPPSLYLPDALYLIALGSVVGLVLLPTFLFLLLAALVVQRWVLRSRRGPGRRLVRHQPLFLPAACAWLPCALASLFSATL